MFARRFLFKNFTPLFFFVSSLALSMFCFNSIYSFSLYILNPRAKKIDIGHVWTKEEWQERVECTSNIYRSRGHALRQLVNQATIVKRKGEKTTTVRRLFRAGREQSPKWNEARSNRPRRNTFYGRRERDGQADSLEFTSRLRERRWPQMM